MGRVPHRVLSAHERAAWLRCQVDGAAMLETARAVRVRGRLDPGALLDRLQALATAEPVLRLAVDVVDGEPLGHPGAGAAPSVEFADAAADIEEQLVADAMCGSDGPPVRLRVYRTGPEEHVLLLGAHPMVAEPRSVAVALRALLDPAFGPAKTEASLAEPTAADRDYWLDRLAGDLPVLDLGPADVRPVGATPVGAPGTGRVLAETTLDAALTTAIGRLAARAGTPSYAILLAATASLLRRYTGVRDVPIGLPLSVATSPTQLRPAANTVVLRVAAGPRPFGRILADVDAAAAAAVRHGRYPFELLVRELNPSRAGTAPLVQVWAVVAELLAGGLRDPLDIDIAHGYGGPERTLGSYRVQPLALARRALPADLVLALTGDRLAVLADPATVSVSLARALLTDLTTLLRRVIQSPDTIDPLPRSALEPAPLEPVRGAELETSLPARFAAHARAHPDRPAVLGDDGEVTYAELAARSAAIALALPRDGGRVGVLLDHGAQTIAAVLGVLASGAAYVPLDPTYPEDRLGYMLAHSGAGTVLTGPDHTELAHRLQSGLPPGTLRVVDVERCTEPAPFRPGPAGPDTPAYVLYTSGSTGRPKGVVQNHRNVLFQVASHVTEHGIRAADRVSVLSSFSFDASVTDLFSALSTGAAAVTVDIRRHGLGWLATALRERRVSVWHSTPTVYRYLLGSLAPGEVLEDVRVVLLGGEELTGRDVALHREHFRPDCALVNGYGATEISFAVKNTVDPRTAYADTDVVPIGRPMPGVDVLLLDPDGDPAVLHGEIAVRSRHVALGYHGATSRDAARFTDHGDGTRTYRTGDLAHRLVDGTLVYAGRRDRQVKVRGYRVELGEVEATLVGLDGVAEAAVLAHTPVDGDTELVGYVVEEQGERAEPLELRHALEEQLPHFAVPQAILTVPELPLTPTGKVDVRALPDPAAHVTAGSAPPADPVQQVIADAWSTALDVPAVGVEDNFFDLGGHSLLMAQVQQQVERDLGREVPLYRMFQHPTVGALSRFLVRSEDADALLADAELHSVRARMQRRRQARARVGGPR